MAIEFLSQANEKYMLDADVASCCLHALALYYCEDGDLLGYITDAEADLISNK